MVRKLKAFNELSYNDDIILHYLRKTVQKPIYYYYKYTRRYSEKELL